MTTITTIDPKRDTKKRLRMDARTRIVLRRTRRGFVHLVKEVVAPALTTAAFVSFPAVAVLAATGIRSTHDFLDAVRNGDPGTATAIALFLMTGTAGTYALRQIRTAREQKQAIDDLRDVHRKDAEEVRDLLRNQTSLDETNKVLRHAIDEKSDEIAVLQYKINTLLNKISSGGLEEEDVKQLWRTVPGSSMTSFQCMFNREVIEVPRPDGSVEFEATAWADNVLQRITTGTALKEWRVIFYIPKIDRRPFAELALFPARKFLFLIDHLAKAAKRQGKEITLAHIRIAVVREVDPKDQFRSIFILTRETNDGPENLVITYHRPPTSRTADYNGGKITVHRGEADRTFYKETADRYFYPDHVKHTGFHLTLDELRRAVATGVFPDVKNEIIGNPGHLAINDRY